MTQMTTMKVPVEVRDRLKKCTAKGSTQGETIARALDALERAEFWSAVRAQVPDAGYWDEIADWQSADLSNPRAEA